MYSRIFTTSIVAALAASASARHCNIHSKASLNHAAPVAVPGPPSGPYPRGTIQLEIDHKVAWDEVGTHDQYDALSNGDGYAWETDGVSIHVLPLGVPLVQDEPNRQVKLLGQINIGKVEGGSDGAAGRATSFFLECWHDWEC